MAPAAPPTAAPTGPAITAPPTAPAAAFWSVGVLQAAAPTRAAVSTSRLRVLCKVISSSGNSDNPNGTAQLTFRPPPSWPVICDPGAQSPQRGTTQGFWPVTMLHRNISLPNRPRLFIEPLPFAVA